MSHVEHPVSLWRSVRTAWSFRRLGRRLIPLVCAGTAATALAASSIALALGGGEQGCEQFAWVPAFAPSPGVDGPVWALIVFDDGRGGGPALYAGGSFTMAGGARANHIARWNGTAWTPLDDGTNGPVYALAVFDDGAGGGPALYAGGSFTMAGGVSASHVARWDGASWAALGGVIERGPLTPAVRALASFDDGSGPGPALYAAGDFATIDGAAVNNIARWSGATWSPLAAGTDGSVSALTVFDDGSGAGAALYVGGDFIFPSGVVARRVARWNGAEWSGLAAGMNGGVAALAVFDDGAGGGAALHAAGLFTTADDQPANRIARWTGRTWTPLGTGLDSPAIALTVFGEGTGLGPSLIAGGSFATAGGVAVSGIARWNGASWASLGGGTNPLILTLASFAPGAESAPALFVGGNFDVSPAGDAYLAKWGCGMSGPCSADLDQDGVVDGADLGVLLVAWGTCNECPADLDGDGIVDGADLNLLLAAWGPC